MADQALQQNGEYEFSFDQHRRTTWITSSCKYEKLMLYEEQSQESFELLEVSSFQDACHCLSQKVVSSNNFLIVSKSSFLRIRRTPATATNNSVLQKKFPIWSTRPISVKLSTKQAIKKPIIAARPVQDSRHPLVDQLNPNIRTALCVRTGYNSEQKGYGPP